MNNPEQLKEYYNERIKQFYDPSFDQLTQRQLKILKNSWGFIFWKLDKAREQFAKSFKQQFVKK